MKYFPLLALVVAVLSSCAGSVNPVGFPLNDDLSEDLSGRWSQPDGEIQMNCDAEGNLVVAGLEWDRTTNTFKTETYTGKVLEMDEDFYVTNLKGEKEDEGYLFALASFEEEDQAIFWFPNNDTLKELIEAGKLVGEAKKHNVVLTGEGEQIAAVLKEQGLEKSFVWQKPIVLWRRVED